MKNRNLTENLMTQELQLQHLQTMIQRLNQSFQSFDVRLYQQRETNREANQVLNESFEILKERGNFHLLNCTAKFE